MKIFSKSSILPLSVFPSSISTTITLFQPFDNGQQCYEYHNDTTMIYHLESKIYQESKYQVQ